MSIASATKRHARVVLAVAAVLSAVIGCRPKEKGGETAVDSAAAPALRVDSAGGVTANPVSKNLTDAQIAQVVLTANSADSAHGELARTKATDAAVKAFARTMIKDHGDLNKQAVALATRLGLTPATSDAAQELEKDASNGAVELTAKSGADFDRAYIDSEVAMHEKVLSALDETLIPQSTNAELKTLLQQARGAVAGHLLRAKTLQKKTTM